MRQDEKLVVNQAIVLLETLRETEQRDYMVENIDSVVKKLRLMVK